MASLKQKKAIKLIVENQGMPISKAMIKAGYRPATVKNPKNLTESDAWQEMLPEDFILATTLKEGLVATRIFSSHTEPDKEVVDHPTRHKFLDTALKLKKKYPTELGGGLHFHQHIEELKNKYV